MVYQVGSPAMLEGKRFFPDTGTPLWKMARRSTVFDDCDPEPLAVATCREKSLTTGPGGRGRGAGRGSRRSWRSAAVVAMRFCLRVPRAAKGRPRRGVNGRVSRFQGRVRVPYGA